VALPDGRPGRRRWVLPVLLEEIGHRGRHRALSLTEDHRKPQPAMSHAGGRGGGGTSGGGPGADVHLNGRRRRWC